MTKLSEAICFATEAFDGKHRKAENTAAVFHSFEAAAIAQTLSDDEDVICAAVLHDIVEDTAVTISQIEEKFGERVAILVGSETEEKYPEQNPSDTWLIRKEKTLEELKNSTDIGVRVMWLGDKLSNLRSLSRLKDRLGDKMWDAFHQKDPEAHKKYYKAIVDELAAFSETESYKEYIALINKVFGE